MKQISFWKICFVDENGKWTISILSAVFLRFSEMYFSCSHFRRKRNKFLSTSFLDSVIKIDALYILDFVDCVSLIFLNCLFTPFFLWQFSEYMFVKLIYHILYTVILWFLQCKLCLDLFVLDQHYSEPLKSIPSKGIKPDVKLHVWSQTATSTSAIIKCIGLQSNWANGILSFVVISEFYILHFSGGWNLFHPKAWSLSVSTSCLHRHQLSFLDL